MKKFPIDVVQVPFNILDQRLNNNLFKKTLDAFAESFISMQSIYNFYEEYNNSERQLRDFIDLDSTFRSVNGEQDEFDDITIKNEQIQ